MNRPRTFYGWVEGGKYKVSLYAKSDPRYRGANTYDSKEQAELECIIKRTDIGHGAPTIIWDSD